MNYIIVNTPSSDRFDLKVNELALRYQFTTDFVFNLGDQNRTYPGGWGCLRFTSLLPEERLFTEPDVEYRYSATSGRWECSSAPVLSDHQLFALYDYFNNRAGGS